MPGNIVIAIDDPSNRDAWGLRPYGAWAAGAYPQGAVVTFAGGLWVANVQTDATPGVDDDWEILVPGVVSAEGALWPAGTWNASTNSPTLASGVGTEGYVFRVGTAGNTTLDGKTGWRVNDLALFLGGAWRKIRNDVLLAADISDSTAAGRALLMAADVAAQRTALGLHAVAVSGSYNDLTQSELPLCLPQGRLTLATGVPVMNATVSAAETLYYTPYLGDRVPLWDGAKIVYKAFAELSQAATDATKSPAAVAADKVYDVFVWDDAGTLRVSRGPAWTNDTTRGYTLTRNGGIWTNTSAITNGPAAGRGTWVGTVISDGASKFNWVLGGSGAGGSAAILGVWNAYNRVRVDSLTVDTTASWSYSTNGWRAANNSNANRATFVTGASEDCFNAEGSTAMSSPSSGVVNSGVGLDSTSSPTGQLGLADSVTLSTKIGMTARLVGNVFGKHFVQLLENGKGVASTTWYGDATGLRFSFMM